MLSKSRYLSGLQCSKRLWIETRERGSLPPVDASTQALFDQGHEVGRLAQQLFPGGLELDRRVRAWSLLLPDTEKALRQRVPLYEGAFARSFEGAGGACRVDLLVPAPEGAWDLYEVKSSTSVKEVNLDDVAFQSWVVRGAGVPLRRSHVVHLDSSYVRGEALEVGKLFAVVDVTEQIAAREREIPGRVSGLLGVGELDAAPAVRIGRQCNDPYDCPAIARCWAGIPEESVFTLYRGGKKSWELFERGIVELTAIPGGFDLTAVQAIQVEAARRRRARVDRTALRTFLNSLEHPLHYFDLESYQLAVPAFPGTRPYQQLPFQFSLQVVDRPGAEARSQAFLAVSADDDPRPAFLEALRALVGRTGSIVAFNATFERSRIAEAAVAVPMHARWAERLAPRFVDLLAPFRTFDYYHPRQLGSASLKAVLPILGQRGYEGLEIQEGSFAAREFLRSNLPGTAPDERERIRRALLAYCARDTEGMIEVVEKLRELVGS